MNFFNNMLSGGLNSSSIPVPVSYALLSQLVQMGYDRERAIQALIHSRATTVEQAVAWLSGCNTFFSASTAVMPYTGQALAYGGRPTWSPQYTHFAAQMPLATPVTPFIPVTPVSPVNLATPVTPVAAVNLATPVTPVAAVNLATPVTPVSPVSLATPVTPVSPVSLATPATPVDPAERLRAKLIEMKSNTDEASFKAACEALLRDINNMTEPRQGVNYGPIILMNPVVLNQPVNSVPGSVQLIKKCGFSRLLDSDSLALSLKAFVSIVGSVAGLLLSI